MALTRYIATRTTTSLATVIVGCVVVFLVMKAAPGDPALAILGENATPEAVAAFRLKHNLDAPVLKGTTGVVAENTSDPLEELCSARTWPEGPLSTAVRLAVPRVPGPHARFTAA